MSKALLQWSTESQTQMPITAKCSMPVAKQWPLPWLPHREGHIWDMMGCDQPTFIQIHSFVCMRVIAFPTFSNMASVRHVELEFVILDHPRMWLNLHWRKRILSDVSLTVCRRTLHKLMMIMIMIIIFNNQAKSYVEIYHSLIQTAGAGAGARQLKHLASIQQRIRVSERQHQPSTNCFTDCRMLWLSMTSK